MLIFTLLFKNFLEEISYAHRGYIYLVKNTVQTVILLKYYNLKFVFNNLREREIILYYINDTYYDNSTIY